MSREVAIKVEGVSKKFTLQHSIEDAVGGYTNELWALRDVSFEIGKGESVALIGPNGSGKSTLLQILAGVTKPTSGRVELNGRIASILDIGAGFHPELSGRENVFLNGQILGFTKKEIQARYKDIIEFSGIGSFIDEPGKNYSNGMYLRLAFSIMAHLDFDVYLLDEVMSVGDVGFRSKCLKKIQRLIAEGGKSFFVISHDMNEVAEMCGKAFLLQQGRVSKDMTINEALFNYTSATEKTVLELPTFVENISVEFKDKGGNIKTAFINTEPITICVNNHFNDAGSNIRLGIRLTDKLSNVVFNASPILSSDGLDTAEVDFNGKKEFLATIPSNLLNGGFFSVDVIYFDKSKVLHELKRVNTFTVDLDETFKGRSIIGESGPLKPYLNWEVK